MQRVNEASVSVDKKIIGKIDRGILALIGVERGDGEEEAQRLADRIVGYRIFNDAAGKMNLSLQDIGGELLAVPQFTLVADTKSGMRPGFSSGAAPVDGEKMFLYLVAQLQSRSRVAAGLFGADMKVSLVNDGPVTFWLQVPPRNRS